MPTTEEHLAKASHHGEFLKTIPDQFPDWLTTVAFYTAVEHIEAFAAVEGYHSKSHEDRKRFVERFCSRIKQDYGALYNASLQARYQTQEHWLRPENIRKELIDKRLHHVKQYMQTQIAKRQKSKGEQVA